MKLYSIDVKIYGTAYIKADSPEHALEIAENLKNECIYTDTSFEGVEISGAKFDDPDLPEVSLSPAMTIHGPDPDAKPELQTEIASYLECKIDSSEKVGDE